MARTMTMSIRCANAPCARVASFRRKLRHMANIGRVTLSRCRAGEDVVRRERVDRSSPCLAEGFDRCGKYSPLYHRGSLAALIASVVNREIAMWSACPWPPCGS